MSSWSELSQVNAEQSARPGGSVRPPPPRRYPGPVTPDASDLECALLGVVGLASIRGCQEAGRERPQREPLLGRSVRRVGASCLVRGGGGGSGALSGCSGSCAPRAQLPGRGRGGPVTASLSTQGPRHSRSGAQTARGRSAERARLYPGPLLRQRGGGGGHRPRAPDSAPAAPTAPRVGSSANDQRPPGPSLLGPAPRARPAAATGNAEGAHPSGAAAGERTARLVGLQRRPLLPAGDVRGLRGPGKCPRGRGGRGRGRRGPHVGFALKTMSPARHQVPRTPRRQVARPSRRPGVRSRP